MTTGVLTPDELVEIIRTTCNAARPAHGTPGAANCLGLRPHEFDAVIGELERRLHIPLLLEARLCGTAAELVAFVNSQATSAA